MTPQEYVQQKAASSGSSFYYAFLFLPPQRRSAITAFYAFCREVDDVVDEVTDPGVAQTKLAWWRNEVHQSFTGKSSHPVMQALHPLCAEFAIEEHSLQSVIEGCEMDLSQTRYLDYPALSRYCHLVAGVVGEVSAKIFGQGGCFVCQACVIAASKTCHHQAGHGGHRLEVFMDVIALCAPTLERDFAFN